MSDQDYLSYPEVAAMFTITTSTLRRMVKRGDFPAPARRGFGSRGRILGWRRGVVERIKASCWNRSREERSATNPQATTEPGSTT